MLPFPRLQVREALGLEHAGGVDEAVKPLDARRHRRRSRQRVREVGGDETPAQLDRQFVTALVVVDDHHLGSLPGEAAADCVSYAAVRSPGDDYRPARERPTHRPSFILFHRELLAYAQSNIILG